MLVRFLKDNTPSWLNAKHRAQWKMTLEVYGKSLMHMLVENIDTPAVLEALKPIWQDKPETASRLRGRIEAVLDAARASGLTPADRLNPARGKAISTGPYQNRTSSPVATMAPCITRMWELLSRSCANARR
jgi:hypothetical protein